MDKEISGLNIQLLEDNENAPIDLLKLADPSTKLINLYLKSSQCYIGKINKRVIGVLVIKEIDYTTIEIKNIAVDEDEQGKGYGTLMLRFAEKVSIDLSYKKILIGTGNSSIGQLRLYQKEGFEIERIEKNFFVRNYKEPIFENGIQCKHKIILVKKIKNRTHYNIKG